MAQFKDGDTRPINGVMYVRQNGQWLPKQQAPMNSPFVDPRLAPQVTKAQNEASASQYDPAKAASDAQIAALNARIKQIEAASAGGLTQAELQKAQLEIKKLQAEITATQTGKGSALDALQSQMDRVGALYRSELQGGLPNQLNDLIPFQSGKDAFDSAAQGLTNPFQSAFKVQGQGSQSDTELKQFMSANMPAQGDSDAVIEEKLGNIQRRIDAERGTLNQPAPEIPEGVAPAQVDIARGQTRTEIDPTLQAVGGKVGQMLASGASGGDVIKFLRDNGVNPNDTSINKALQYRNTPAFKTWQRANPGKPYPIGPDFYTKEVPMSGTRAMFNKTAATDAGGATASFVASAGNAVTGGRLDNFADNPGNARVGMDLLRGKHPYASFAGDMAGQGMVEATVNRIPGVRGLTASRWGQRGTDALYGAYSGSGEADGNAGLGAVTGALVNATGGMVGRGTQRGLGRTFTGVRNPNLAYLNNAGVPLTIGQIGRGSDNVGGHIVGGIEERFAGLPIADAIIASARRRGDEGFNRAAFRELGGTGATGAAGIGEGADLVHNAYNFLDNSTVPLDAQYAGRNAAVRAELPNLPAFGPQIDTSLNRLDRAAQNGVLSGRDWQSGVRSTRSNRASIRGREFSDDAVNSLGEVENNLLDLAARQGPPGTIDNLNNANNLNARFQTISSALDNGPAQKAGELFSAGRLDDASRINARNFGGRTNSLTGNRPFYELTTAGKEVMPNLTPDSGTAGRSLFYASLPAILGGGAGAAYGGLSDDGSAAEGGAVGAGGGAAGTVVPAAVMAMLYSRRGQRGLQGLMLGPRNRNVERIGDALINNPRLGGMFGASALRDYFLQDELGQ